MTLYIIENGQRISYSENADYSTNGVAYSRGDMERLIIDCMNDNKAFEVR